MPVGFTPILPRSTPSRPKAVMPTPQTRVRDARVYSRRCRHRTVGRDSTSQSLSCCRAVPVRLRSVRILEISHVPPRSHPMPEQPLDLTISLRDDVDEEELAQLTRQLR